MNNTGTGTGKSSNSADLEDLQSVDSGVKINPTSKPNPPAQVKRIHLKLKSILIILILLFAIGAVGAAFAMSGKSSNKETSGDVTTKYPEVNGAGVLGDETKLSAPALGNLDEVSINGNLKLNGNLELSKIALNSILAKINLSSKVDLVPSVGGVSQTGSILINGSVVASSFQGNGADLLSINASNISSGTLNNDRLDNSVTRLGQTIPLTALQSSVSSTLNGFDTTSGDSTIVAGTGITVTTNTSTKEITVSSTTSGGDITGVSVGSGLVGGGTSGDLTIDLDSNTVTLQGNTFNGASQLVKLDSSSQLPAVSGANLTNLNAGNIVLGTLSDSRLSTNVTLLGNSFNASNQLVQLNGSGALPSLSGANLTSLSASNISSGSLSDSRLSANVTLQGNTFNSSGQLVKLNGAGELPALSGINLTNLNASNLVAGSLSDSRLSANVTLQGNTFNLSNKLVQLNGSGALPSLSGANLTSLSASNISSGSLSDSRLSANVSLLNASQTFSGAVTFSQPITVNTIQPSGSMVIGATNQSLTLQGDMSSKLVANDGANSVAIGFTGTPTGDVIYNLDAATTPGTYTLCTSVGNCASAGGGVTTLGGTTNKLVRFTGSQSIGDSSISDTGSLVTIGANGLFKAGSDSTTAFRVQNAAGSTNVFTADTTNNRVAIGQATASYSLDVAGDINSTTGLRVGGNLVCDNTGCLAGSGSGFYIQNSSSLQTSANINIESANTTNPTLVLKAKTSQTANLLEAKNSSSSVVASIDASGNINTTGQFKVNGSQIASSNLSDSSNIAKLNSSQTFTDTQTFKNSSDSTSAFQIQNAAGTSNLLVADTVNTRLGVGTSSPGYTLDVNGDVNIASGSSYRVNGVAICGGSGTCAPSAGSSNYIQNSSALQTNANFNIQSGSSSSVVSILKGATGQTADILQARDSSDNVLAKITSNGTIYQGSYQVCDTSNNCGYAVSSGSTNYIQNSTSQQAGNFNVKSASSSSVVAKIQGATSQTADLLNVNDGTGTTVAAIDKDGNLSATSISGSGSGLTNLSATNISSGNLSDSRLSSNVVLKNASQTISGSNTFTGTSLFQNTSNSTSAFQIQNAAGTSNTLVADTTNNRVGIGKSSPGYTLDVGGDVNIASGSALKINGSNICTSSGCQADSSTVIQNGTAVQTGNFNVQSGSASSVTAVISAVASQTVDTLQVKDSNGSVVLSTNSTTPNLISNPSFDTNTTGWAAYNSGVISRVTSQQAYGPASLQISSTGVGDGAKFPYALVSGTPYTFSIYYKSSTALTAMDIGYSVDGTTITNCSAFSAYSSLIWQRITCNFTPTGTTAGAFVFVRATTAGAKTYYVDAAQLELTVGGAASDYQQGTIALNGIINSPVTIRNTANSVNVFDIQNSAGQSYFTFDTSSLTSNAGTFRMPYTGSILYGYTGAYHGEITGSGLGDLTVQGNGAVFLKTTSNSASALQVQNSISNVILNVDSSTTGNANLITNPSFDTNTTGYAATTGATLSRTTSDQFSGAGALSVVTTATSNAGARYSYTLAASTTYSLSLYARAVGSNFSTFEIGYTNDGSTSTSCATAQTVITTAWTRYTCTFTVAASPTGTRFVYLRQTDATARTFYIDGVQLEAASAATNYSLGAVSLNGVINSAATFKNQSDSTTAFQVQNASGTNQFSINTSTNVTTVAGSQFIVKNSSDSTTAMTIQNAGGTAFFTADSTNMKITVKDLAVTGHIISGGTTPGIAANAGAGTSPTVSISGTDTAGTITLTTGSSPTTSADVVTVTFASAFASAPQVVFSPTNANAAALATSSDVYATPATGNFKLTTGSGGLSAATQYKWTYHVIQ